MVGPLTVKLGTLIYYDKSSGSKQQQTTSAKKTFNGVCVFIVGPLTMKLGALMNKKHVNDEKTSEAVA